MNVVSIAMSLVVIGYILVIIELFVPGFGIFGILGGISTVAGVILGLMYVPYFWVVVVIIIISFFVLIKYFKFPKKLILDDKVGDDVQSDKTFLIGKEGVTLTVLKPVGKCNIEDVDYECYSNGIIIQKGVKIVVREVKDNKIFVKPLDEKVEDIKSEDIKTEEISKVDLHK